MPHRTRRLLRVSRQLREAIREQKEQAITRVYNAAADVRRWYPQLERYEWQQWDTFNYLEQLGQDATKEDEEVRLNNWREKMDWCDKDAMNWVKKGEDIDPVTGLDTLVDWQQQADQIRE